MITFFLSAEFIHKYVIFFFNLKDAVAISLPNRQLLTSGEGSLNLLCVLFYVLRLQIRLISVKKIKK